ncbi:MAG: CatB-related O-acetyltransferase [Rickettsiaceae bacterium]|nr:MAG: CatB-related O-acetyltransferase [Rickettsiaceae bacterium]
MSSLTHPDPNVIYPIKDVKRTCFLKNIITNKQIKVGDYTYYDDLEDIYNFEKNVLYLFDFLKDELIIGKFCQIASGVTFIMNGANHANQGISTYPFKIFGHSWRDAPLNANCKGNTSVGHDVWIGNSAIIMPGIKIGCGAIIGAHSLVTKNVEPYTIVGGNPHTVIRKRFSDDEIEFLLKLQWWDWHIEKITANIYHLTNCNVAALKQLLPINK